MKVFLRISKGWSKPVENNDKETCDIDGARLRMGPGNQTYCDLEHDLQNFTASNLHSLTAQPTWNAPVNAAVRYYRIVRVQ